MNKWKSKSSIPWIFLALAVLLLVFLNAFYLENWLDSDMAAEMMFSRLLSEEGHLFASNHWFYSTEFRLLYTQLIMAPLFSICSSWHVIRMITNLVFYVLLLVSYFYCMACFPVKEKYKVLCALGLLLPFSETMMLHMQMGNTYMSHVIILFFYFGLFLRASGLKQGKASALSGSGRGESWKKTITCILFIILGVLCGLSGVRYMLAMQAPLFLTAFWYLMKGDKARNLRYNVSKDTWKELTGELIRSDRMKLLGISILGVVSCMAGYLINVLYVSRKYSFQTYESTNFIDVYQGVFLERLQNAFGSILMLFGYIPGKGVLSLRGMITLAAFAMLAVLLFMVLRTRKLLQILHEQEEVTTRKTLQVAETATVSESMPGAVPSGMDSREVLVLFFLMSFCLNSFVFVFTNSTLVPRYYITTFMFLLPILAVFLTEEKIPGDRVLVGFLLTCCILAATGKTTLSMMTTNKNADRLGAIAYLEENGYDFGYATYWNGNITQELSNGTLELANISDPETFQFFKWSSAEKYYEPTYAKGKVFLLLTAEEAQEFADCENVKAGEKVYEDEAFVIYGYESADAQKQS